MGTPARYPQDQFDLLVREADFFLEVVPEPRVQLKVLAPALISLRFIICYFPLLCSTLHTKQFARPQVLVVSYPLLINFPERYGIDGVVDTPLLLARNNEPALLEHAQVLHHVETRQRWECFNDVRRDARRLRNRSKIASCV